MMATQQLLQSIKKHIALTQDQENFLVDSFISKSVKQGEFLENPGEVTRYLMFVNTGCLMTYYTDPSSDDHVLQFATPGWWTGDLGSIQNGTPSMFSTRALAESDVLFITRAGLNQLLEKHQIFERFFRILFQNSLITQQGRILQNLSVPAEERYINFTKKYPTLEQFVPQKYIASYLGITPEFLSKIRRKLMDK